MMMMFDVLIQPLLNCYLSLRCDYAFISSFGGCLIKQYTLPHNEVGWVVYLKSFTMADFVRHINSKTPLVAYD